MKKIKFFDENTRQWWTPATGYLFLTANEVLLPLIFSEGPTYQP